MKSINPNFHIKKCLRCLSFIKDREINIDGFKEVLHFSIVMVDGFPFVSGRFLG